MALQMVAWCNSKMAIARSIKRSHFIQNLTEGPLPDSSRKIEAGLCSSRARWPLAPNFCPRVTRKSQIFHTNYMLGTLDFTVSEHWASFNFP